MSGNVSSTDLRKLVGLASKAGADRAWLRRVAGELVEQQLRLADLERLVDRRRVQAAAIADQVAGMLERGFRRRMICDHLKISPSAYQRARERILG
jgi:hypothetical protein